MINGLQAKVRGFELRKFIQERAEHHRERAVVYQQQVDLMENAGIEVGNVSGDPKAGAVNKVKTHTQAAEELEFMALYIDTAETYILSTHDLQRLGKVSSGGAW